jgi:hypothetical protein
MRWVMVSVLLGAVGFSATAGGLRVVILDYAAASRAALEAASMEARTALRDAGVETEWAICQVSSDPAQHCDLPAVTDYVQVKIVPKPVSGDGFASSIKCRASEGCFTSWVYYQRVADFARKADQPTGVALAYVMAHEIGHLMGMDHSPSGIMKAHFDVHDLLDAARGRLRFAREDARTLRAGVAIWTASFTTTTVAAAR